MWRLSSSSDVDGLGRAQPGLRTENGNLGRQVWVWDEGAGSEAERETVEGARKAFSATRLERQHAADELLRLQSEGRRRVGPFPVPRADAVDGSPDAPVEDATLKASLLNGISYYESLQADDGHWPGDYGGPMFLLPGLVFAGHVTGAMDRLLPAPHRREAVRYLRNHQNSDGGWGLHVEGPSTMLGTCLNYVAMRLLGVEAGDACASRARAWILERGGATYISSWGKLWLAVLGVYDWAGMNPMPPEMWLLPHAGWTGIGWLHPGRFWCHCRMVYLPMSFLYGGRFTGPKSELIESLKREIYPESEGGGYGGVDWDAARSRVASEDLYYPHPKLQDALWWSLSRLEPVFFRTRLGRRLRARALATALEHVRYEDENTRYVDIGPVNKVLNYLVRHFHDPSGPGAEAHIPRFSDYLWVAEDGLKMQGYNGSQLWDTSFAAQAILAAGPDVVASFLPAAGGAEGPLARAQRYVLDSQVTTEAEAPLDKYYRHVSVGAWPFSTKDHGWPISDCSSEGLKAALALGSALAGPASAGASPSDPSPLRLSTEAGRSAVDVILTYQNPTGGCATYENSRSFAALELINPAETFGDIVIDYDYVECTSACATALAAACGRPDLASYRREEVDAFVARAVEFTRSQQRPDGSWYGSWGVCFTYGAWFGAEALALEGESVASSTRARRAAAFLLSKQRPDGGWGESHESCSTKRYCQLPEGQPSHVVNTAWAMLALLALGLQDEDPRPLHRAARCLLAQQIPGDGAPGTADGPARAGDFPQQTISGVFNRNCTITYANYRNIFPIWALGRYRGALVSAVATRDA